MDPAAAVDDRRINTLPVHTLAVHAVQPHYLVVNPEEEAEDTTTISDSGWMITIKLPLISDRIFCCKC